ncbi:threonine aldolase family protein [Fulvivirga ligni]|uniref:threonine aldolase family protein n=1 Tax=Fulvivirga ligni TaxID=2904246 RepID=UPI001F32F9C5|nr:aminotransferase class I/II-fold pyridoxal phosphate-dependent enzyme [Fulvivirga ligni]UII23578.1 aminotransferase class I/II-fold pyridoxal phosphate-dependent enzyme [Fulvivirga ligni]
MTNTKDNRRDFLKKSSLSALPFLFPVMGKDSLNADKSKTSTQFVKGNKPVVNFVLDGLHFSPGEYLHKLQEISKTKAIEPDFYGAGGATKQLEEQFAQLTGKEKAIYLPSGTMANQLAIKLLNGNSTKVMVPENSHIYRDEADAAQSVHGERLMPVGEGKPYYDLKDLQSTIAYSDKNEVFKSGLGTVVIENPVRRADGAYVPLEVIKNVSKYCQDHDYKMHLDGARIHIASAFSNVSVAEYASYFDTVYISLYKYLNAAGGAILCGDAALIDQIPHLIKIYGGTMYQSWTNTAMALHYFEDIDSKWEKVAKVAQQLIADLNKIEGITITSIQNGSNIFDLVLSSKVDLKALANNLYSEHGIWLGRATDKGIVKFTVNESLLTRDYNDILSAWKKAMDQVIK